MQETKIVRWCDLCALDGHGNVDAVDVELVINGRAVAIDLCSRHYDAAVQVLLDAATTVRSSGRTCPICGQRRAQVGRHVNADHAGIVPPGWLTCHQCGRVVEGARGLAQHRRQIHGEEAVA